MYIEIGFKEDAIIDLEKQLELTLENLKKCGIISDHQLVAHKALIINPGYVHITKQSNEKVNDFRKMIAEDGIYTIGRYGKWTYCSIEDCMIDAMELANKKEK